MAASKKNTDLKKILVVVLALAVVFAGVYYFAGMQNTRRDESSIVQGQDFVLGVGETVTIRGITLEVVSIGATSASIKVEGVAKIIGKGETFDFGSVKVAVNKIEYTDDINTRKVYLVIG